MSQKIIRVKAHYISPTNIAKDKIPNYHELMEGTREMVPVKIKKAVGTYYHILEDKNGGVYLLKSDDVMILKLEEIGLEKSQTEYLLTVKERSEMMNKDKGSVAEGKRMLEAEEIKQVDVLDDITLDNFEEKLVNSKEEKDKLKKTRKKRAKKTEKKDE